MKSLFRTLLVVFAGAILFSSCSKSNDEGKMIPKDAMFVAFLNTKSLLDKVSWEDVKQTSWYKQLYADTSTKPWVKKMLDNPENSGIDVKAGIAFFVQKGTGNDYHIVLEGKLNDEKNFEQFNQNFAVPATVTKDGDVSMLTLREQGVVGWSDKHFAYVSNSSSFANKYSSQWDTLNNQANMAPAAGNSAGLSAYCKKLFSITKDSSLSQNEKFGSLLSEKGDVHAWINTVNRLCASGLQAIMDASRAIMCGDGSIYLAGGVESMTRAPFVMSKSEGAYSRKAEIYDSTIGWRFPNKKLIDKYYPYSMGETAENVAKQWKISRHAQDEFAFSSQQKYFAALAAGKWKDEIVPVEITPNKTDKIIFSVDEHPRKSSLEKLSGLKPAFIKEGTVTAGNSSGINDGAAMLLLANENAVKKSGLEPMVRVISMAVAGVDPAIMGIGPVPATRKALERAGLTVSDLGLIEMNEAFASQAIACIHELGLDLEKVNVNGGSIAIGHPLGCSGARISTTLLYEMKRRGVKYGLATMCVGVGQGAAIIYENVL